MLEPLGRDPLLSRRTLVISIVLLAPVVLIALNWRAIAYCHEAVIWAPATLSDDELAGCNFPVLFREPGPECDHWREVKVCHKRWQWLPVPAVLVQGRSVVIEPPCCSLPEPTGPLRFVFWDGCACD